MSLFGNVDEAQILIEKKEFTKAINILKPLALQGDLRANYLLGKAYFERKMTYTDYKFAKKYFELSNYPNANLYLAKMYKDGLGVKEDIQKSIYYLKELNSPESNYILYKLYSKGELTIKDLKSALNYLKSSAESGYQKAQYILGELYLTNNKIVDKNLSLAAKWLKTATNNGCKKSKELWNKYQLWRFEDK
jgi:TPR repeat protein